MFTSDTYFSFINCFKYLASCVPPLHYYVKSGKHTDIQGFTGGVEKSSFYPPACRQAGKSPEGAF
jgi:hypothetical protein